MVQVTGGTRGSVCPTKGLAGRYLLISTSMVSYSIVQNHPALREVTVASYGFCKRPPSKSTPCGNASGLEGLFGTTFPSQVGA